MKKALIVQGGYEPHQPAEMAALFAEQLRQHDFEVTIADSLDAYHQLTLTDFDVISPNWTMGDLPQASEKALLAAVESGVGVAGLHGGLGDAFRKSTDFQFMAGAQFVAHPGNDGVRYPVYIDGAPSPITAGLTDFEVVSEQYYIHYDPAVTVLATTRFGDVVMPVAFTKTYGKGRVFYMTLGHRVEVIRDIPQALTMMTRGLLWAANAL